MTTVKFNVYADEKGAVSLENGDGKTLVAVAGTTIEDADAQRLGLPELFQKANEERVERAKSAGNPLASLGTVGAVKSAKTDVKTTAKTDNGAGK